MSKKQAPKTHKKCKTCKKELPISKFEEVRKGVFRGVCRVCHSWVRSAVDSATPKTYISKSFSQLKSTRTKQGLEFTLCVQDVFDLWEAQKGRCALSGVLMTHHKAGHYGNGAKGEFNVSIDRINPAGPYVKANVQLVAWRVNAMKNTLSEEMFFWWVRNLHNRLLEKDTSTPVNPTQ